MSIARSMTSARICAALFRRALAIAIQLGLSGVSNTFELPSRPMRRSCATATHRLALGGKWSHPSSPRRTCGQAVGPGRRGVPTQRPPGHSPRTPVGHLGSDTNARPAELTTRRDRRNARGKLARLHRKQAGVTRAKEVRDRLARAQDTTAAPGGKRCAPHTSPYARTGEIT